MISDCEGLPGFVQQTDFIFEAVTLPALYVNHSLEWLCDLVSLSIASDISAVTSSTVDPHKVSSCLFPKSMFTGCCNNNKGFGKFSNEFKTLG